MKIRNLLVLVTTVALATICASAQEGEVTIKDHINQSLTVSRFGIVRKFIDRDGNEFLPKHTFRICSCNNDWPCFESEDTKGATATLVVLSPKKRKNVRFPLPQRSASSDWPVLQRGQSLQLQATIAFPFRTVMRRLVWNAGSGRVHIQTLTWSGGRVCCINEQSLVPLDSPHYGCSLPPPNGFNLSCPPPPALFRTAPRDSSQHSKTFTLDFLLWNPRSR